MKKFNKKQSYSKKYKRALSSVPHNIEYKDLLIQDKNNKLKKIEPLDVIYEGSSFGLILDMYRDLQESHSDYKKSVGHSISSLISLLKEKGYNTPNIELNALINDINNLLIIEPDKEYTGYEIVDGYVVGYGYDIIMVKGLQPEDFNKGYWKLIDREWVLDEIKYNQYWSVI